MGLLKQLTSRLIRQPQLPDHPAGAGSAITLFSKIPLQQSSVPDLSGALRAHRQKVKRDWLDSAPVQMELMESFDSVFDEMMGDGLPLSDRADNPVLELVEGDLPVPLANRSRTDHILAEEMAGDDDGDGADGFAILFRANG